jgi:small subunit ribosomal protein S6
MYEGMFLLDSNQYARDPKGVSRQISQMLEKCSGQVLVSRLWSEQKLAYPIKGHRKGTYWLTYFRMPGKEITRLTRESQLNNNVLRSLFVSVDERLADTLVKHATSGAASVAEPQPAAAAHPAADAPTGGTDEENDE